jgi:septum formation protein
MANIVLASTSPYRRELLQRLGVPFVTASPGVDEDVAHRDAPGEPARLAASLARHKADAVAVRRRDSIVIGADQVCALGAEVLRKPGTVEAAIGQLLRLAGATHRLFTAVAIVSDDRVIEILDETVLTMRPLTSAEARRYVERDLPLDCAGAYKLEAGGIALFERVETRDHTAVVGLPLIEVTSALRELGIPIP